MTRQPPDSDLPETVPIHVALSRVMADIGAIGKDRRADPKMGGYAFRGIDDLYNALHGPLSKHGVFYWPKIVEPIVEDTYKTSGGATMRLVRLTMVYTFVGPAGDTIEVGPVVGEAADTADKAANKAMTAALKYLLFQMFCIPVEGESSAVDADAGTPDLGEQVDRVHEQLLKAVELKIAEAVEVGVDLDVDKVRAYAQQKRVNAEQALRTITERVAEAATAPLGDDGERDGSCEACGKPGCDDPHDQPEPDGEGGWTVEQIAAASPDWLVEAGVVDDLDEAARAVEEAQAELNRTETNGDGPYEPEDAEGRGEPAPDPRDAHSGSEAVVLEPDVVEAYLETVPTAGPVVWATPVAEVLDKVSAGEWVASTTLAYELASDRPRSTLVPKLEDLCDEEKVSRSRQLGRLWQERAGDDD